MKVSEVMMRTPASCGPETNLGAVVEVMWDRNCGFLPVVDAEKKVQGVVTDRDICIALGTRNQLPGNITAVEVARKQVRTCEPDEDIHVALATMQELGIRRLPVVDSEGVLMGVLSMDDLILHAQGSTRNERITELSTDEVVRALKAIYAHHLPVPAGAKARVAFAN